APRRAELPRRGRGRAHRDAVAGLVLNLTLKLNHMKLSKFLLLGLLGLCVALMACDKEKGHPTSSFGECPLLAHAAPKLNIKTITMEQTVYRDSEVIGSGEEVYEYDREQRLLKCQRKFKYAGGYRYSYDDEFNYEYDANGSLLKETFGYKDAVVEGLFEYFYDEYGFLVEIKYDKETWYTYRYKDDTVFMINRNDNLYFIYSDDMWPIYGHSSSGESGYWIWKNGNLVSQRLIDENGNETYEEYDYDDKENIYRLTTNSRGPDNMRTRICLCKNNQFDGRTSYTYTEKGMVATMTRTYNDNNEKWVYAYTYLYY
ncbi:MAG: hypothetical protein K2F84_02235, partial [Bacteroidales bacterium]|nr:hypothetical protein [Bacteroidales bacterium]